MRLKDKVVAITGGSQGIGEALARRFAREGAAVAILNRTAATGKRAADAIVHEGGRAAAVPCDIARIGDLQQAVARVHAAFGDVDVLVNNAGAYFLSPLGGTDEDAFDAMIGTNLKGAFFLSQAVLPDFERKGRGKIINIGSIFGNDGFPGSAVYCATKGAIHLLTKTLALELRDRNIQVNAIAPGWIETPLNADYRATSQDFMRRASERFGGGNPWMKPDELTGAAVSSRPRTQTRSLAPSCSWIAVGPHIDVDAERDACGMRPRAEWACRPIVTDGWSATGRRRSAR